MKKTIFLFLAASFLVLTPSFQASSGGPYVVDQAYTGKFYKWPGGKVEVWMDKGPLSTTGPAANQVTAEQAKQMVLDAFKVWENASLPLADINDRVPAASVKFIYKGELDEDVTKDNYDKYNIYSAGEANSTRPAVIIFDQDGAITADMVEKGHLPDGALDSMFGLTNIPAVDPAKKNIVNAVILLNGNRMNDDVGRQMMKVAIIHELGHVLNLDHSAVNDDVFASCRDEGEGCEYLPTMFRSPASPDQESLHYDDAAWLGFLYNLQDANSNIMKKYCFISGELFDEDGRGFQGAQITASEVNDPRSAAVTSVSGWMYPPCAVDNAETGKKAGLYIVPGVRPGKKYKVSYGPIPNWCASKVRGECSMGSGINPYAPPRDLESGNIEFSGGGFEFECAEGGKEIAAKQAKLGVNLNDSEYRRYEFDGQKYACEPGVGKVIDETEGDEAVSPYGMPVSKKGWCSLSPKAPPEAFALLLILPALATLVLRFRRP